MEFKISILLKLQINLLHELVPLMIRAEQLAAACLTHLFPRDRRLPNGRDLHTVKSSWVV